MSETNKQVLFVISSQHPNGRAIIPPEQLINFKMSEIVLSRRSSQQASPASDVSSANQRITIVHPKDRSLDAVLFNFERLKLLLAQDIRGFEDRFDFVNMSDVDLDEFFVTKRVHT